MVTGTAPRVANRPGSDSAPGTDPGTFHHGARSSFNAAFFALIDRYANHVGREHKRLAMADLPGGTIVEIGAGVGANFDYFPRGAHVIAVEPNLAMIPRLVDRARNAGVALEVRAAAAEALPFPDGSVDAVIATLVLCTVDDPDAVLAEIRRVLKPGGTFRFVEHVAAPPASARALLQRAIRRPWRWIFEGCDPHRHTATAIERAGFARVELHRRKFRHSLFIPVNTAIHGIARA